MSSAASELHDIGVMVNAFDTYLAGYFEDETPPEEKRSMEGKARSLRRRLLFQLNAIVDVYESWPDKKGLDQRELLLWDIVVEDAKKYGIVLTSDGKMFTLEKDESSATE